MNRSVASTPCVSLAALVLPGVSTAVPVINCMDTGPIEIIFGALDDQAGEVSFDIDCNGEADFVFDANPGQIRIDSVDTASNLVASVSKNTKGFYVERLGEGQTVQLDKDDIGQGFFFNDAFEPRDPLEWRGMDAFAGVQFERAGMRHLGWVRMQIVHTPIGSPASATIVNYAYESQPAQSIDTQIVDNIAGEVLFGDGFELNP